MLILSLIVILNKQIVFFNKKLMNIKLRDIFDVLFLFY